MKREHWQNGQIVLTNDLDWAQESKESEIRARTLDAFDCGVLANSQFGAEPYPFSIIPGYGNTTITVNTGIAFGPDGERIVIDALENYDSGNTSLIPPISSGNANIPLPNIAANKTYYVWISYFNAKDPNVFTISSDGASKIYPKVIGGFEIKITEDNTNPNSGTYLFLGTVTTNSVALVDLAGISVSGRATASTRGDRVGIRVETASRPATYANGEKKFLQDHIAAIGSGNISPNNPHGLAPEDLGLTIIEGQNHQSKLHTNGIFTTNQNSDFSALFMYVYAPTESNTDRIVVKKLTDTYRESAVVNGKTLTPAMMTNDGVVTFQALPELDGKYYLIYLDSADLSIKKSEPFDDDYGTAFSTLLRDHTILPICSIQWKHNPSPGFPDNYNLIYNTLKDRRVFGNTGNANIHPHIIGGIASGSAIGNRTTTLYRGSITNNKTDNQYNVLGLTIRVLVDNNVNERVVTFSGVDPIPLSEIVRQINASDLGANGVTAYITRSGNLRLLAVTSLQTLPGTANAELGLISETSDVTLKEIGTVNDYSGRSVIEYDEYNRIATVQSVYGNKSLIQTFIYSAPTEDADLKQIIEQVD